MASSIPGTALMISDKKVLVPSSKEFSSPVKLGKFSLLGSILGSIS